MAGKMGWVVFGLALTALPMASGQQSRDNPQSLAHIDTARSLAGTTLTAPFDFFCVPANARANSADAPELEPVRLFDDLYAAGNSETVVFAIETSDGIILIDAGYADRVDSVLVPGLEALGLDPADVRLLLVAHGHADHFGGAAYFQDRYGTRIGMAAADWEVVEGRAAANPSAAASPQRDLVISDGQPIELGEVTITPVLIPGHTPGSLAFIFPVTDRGTAHTAGLFGGTLLSSFLRAPLPELTEYIGSIDRYLAIARDMNVDVEIQNHPIFDDMPAKLAALESRAPGAPHPFVVGSEGYVRFWTIISECIQAEMARRGDDAP